MDNSNRISLSGRLNRRCYRQKDVERCTTLEKIPSRKTMARKLIPVITLDRDGELGAVGGDGTTNGQIISEDNKAIVPNLRGNHQYSLQTNTELRSRVSQELVIDALITLLCKHQYPEEESQKQLYRVIWNFLREKRVFPGYDSKSANAIRAHFQQKFEALLQQAKFIIQDPKSSNLFLQQPLIILKQDESNYDWREHSTCSLYVFEKPKYSSMFTDIEKIARGGGGVVYKAKHVVDESLYAIKIIPIKACHMQSKEPSILEEAKVLAQLNHSNIVSYKTAWIDHCTDPECFSSAESSPIADVCDSSSAKEINQVSNENSETSSIIFEQPPIHESHLEGDLNKKIFSRSLSMEERPKLNALALCDSISNKQIVHKGRGDQLQLPPLGYNSQKSPICQTVLIIQMELCAYTLRDWLDRRREKIIVGDVFGVVDEMSTLSLFKSILLGVEYIHDKKLIHRDLKPSNIFFDKNGQVKIGDFGLAAIHLNEENNDGSLNKHTSYIGTKQYAAPEQLDSNNYDSKADMWSLGVNALELYHPFSTEMEREKCIQAAKKLELPKAFVERWPQQASLILALLSPCPSNRPSAKEIINSSLFRIPENVCKTEFIAHNEIPEHQNNHELLKIIEDLKIKNRALEEENRKLKDENRKLKNNKEKIRLLQSSSL